MWPELIPLFKVFMADSAADSVRDVLQSGYIGEGPRVELFEAKLRDFLNHDELLTVNSGTSALHLAYHLAVHRDDIPVAGCPEIISTPITCTATNTPIIANGAKVVWADVDPITGNIDPHDIERKITKRTRAIVMVHWGGNPCDIEAIVGLAHAHDIPVVQDAAHAFGALYKSTNISQHSDFVAYSFQAIKHVTSVDGGCLTTNSPQDTHRAQLLRWYGIDRTRREGIDLRCELDVAEAGYKFHMNDVSAAVGTANLEYAEWIISRHRENAAFYDEAFADHPGIRTVPENPLGKSPCWLYTFHVDNRDELMHELNQHNVMASKVHARNDTHSMFRDCRTELPNASQFNDTHVCIPVGWWVDAAQREYIAACVRKFAQRSAPRILRRAA